MKLEEAIKYLNISANDAQKLGRDKQMRACELGIEALKRLTDGRDKGYDYFGHSLPGETKN